MLLLSPHIDTVRPLELEFNGTHSGLLDNWLGVMATYLAIYRTPSILKLIHEGKVGVFHSKHEEFGLDDLPNKGIDLAIVVDVCSGKRYEGVDIALENISTPGRDFVTPLKGFLKWEGYKVITKKYTGEDEDADESWTWIEKGVPTFTCILPVDGDYHQNTTCPSERVDRFAQALARVVCYCL